MNLEQLEFSITQYLDGTLPADEVSALEERLAKDEQAREVLEQHRKLLGMLRGFCAPELEWTELAKDFSAVVTGTVDESSRAEDRKLNEVLRSAMPPVPAVNWGAFGVNVSKAIDAELEATDAQDAKLDELLHAASMPEVNWGALSSRISESIAAQADAAEAAQHQRMRIFSTGWARAASALAVAAVIVVATTLGLRSYLDGGNRDTNTATATPRIEVQGPQQQVATAKAVVEIEIGPTPGFNESTEMASRPASVFVSAATGAVPPGAVAVDDSGF